MRFFPRLGSVSLTALLLLIAVHASANTPAPQGTQRVLVLLSQFEDDLDDVTFSVDEFDSTESSVVLDSVRIWTEESSFHHTNQAPLATFEFDIVPYSTIPGDGQVADPDDIGPTLDANLIKALIAAINGGLDPDTLSTYDRILFGYSRKLGYHEFSPPVVENGAVHQEGPSNHTFVDTISAEPAFAPFTASYVHMYPWAHDYATAPDIVHEFLHTYDLAHARSVSSIDQTSAEYGNLFCVMGSHSIPRSGGVLPDATEILVHMNSFHKERFAWIDPIPTPDSTGVYRIGPLATSLGTDSNAPPRALKIPRNDNGDYLYLEFRPPVLLDGAAPAANRFNLDDGLVVLQTRGERASYAIDCTPETPQEQSYDYALPIGRSYTDYAAGVCIVPLAVDADTISLAINHLSDRSQNEPPSIVSVSHSIDSVSVSGSYIVTLTADAADADSDTLYYFWNLDVDLTKTRRYSVPVPEGAEPCTLSFTDDYYYPGRYGHGPTITHVFDSDTPRKAYLRVSDGWGGHAPWTTVRLWDWAPDTLFVPSEYAELDSAIVAASGGDVVILEDIGVPHGASASGIGLRGKRIRLAGESTTNGLPDVTIDLTNTDLRAFDLRDQENGRSVIADLRIVGAGSAEQNGGGARIQGSSRPVFSNCVFEDCSGAYGGGAFVAPPARGIFRRCVFRGNSAISGGAVYASAATEVGPSSLRGGLTVDECTLVRNTSTGTTLGYWDIIPGGARWEPSEGGGAVYYNEATATPGYSHLAIVLSVIAQNSAGCMGGGLYLRPYSESVRLIGNTIADNRADVASVGGLGHGAYLCDDFELALAYDLTFEGCAFWDHDPSVTGTIATADFSKVVLNHCLVHDSWTGSGTGNVLTLSDPGFLDPRSYLDAVDGDYGLDEYSLCIDAGKWIPGQTINDRYGRARYDDLGVPNTGDGPVPYVDIGAIERQSNSGTTIEINASVERQVEKFIAVVGDWNPVEMTCKIKPLYIGHHHNPPNNDWYHRVFLEFSTSDIPDNAIIDYVDLSLTIYEGMGDALHIKAMPQHVSDYTPVQCGGLFGSINGTALYHSSLGWDGPMGTERTVDLGTQACADLQANLGDNGSSDGQFSVGMRSAVEGFEDVMEIYGIKTLRVVYHLP